MESSTRPCHGQALVEATLSIVIVVLTVFLASGVALKLKRMFKHDYLSAQGAQGPNLPAMTDDEINAIVQQTLVSNGTRFPSEIPVPKKPQKREFQKIRRPQVEDDADQISDRYEQEENKSATNEAAHFSRGFNKVQEVEEQFLSTISTLEGLF